MTTHTKFDIDKPGSGTPERVDVFERMHDGGRLTDQEIRKIRAAASKRDIVPIMTDGRMDKSDPAQKFIEKIQDGQRLWMTLEVTPRRETQVPSQVGEIEGELKPMRCAGPFVDRRHAEKRQLEWVQDMFSHRSLVLVVEAKNLTCS